MNSEQIELMEWNTSNLKNLAIMGSEKVPSSTLSIASMGGAPELRKEAIWEETTSLYRPYFPAVTPVSYDYYMKMRLAYEINNQFNFLPNNVSTPKAISMTASGFRKNLKDADVDSEEGVENLNEQIIKTFLQGFQNQGAETLSSISKQDPNGNGVALVARVGACSYCKRAAGEFDTSNFKAPTFHKNCGCGKLPIWK